MKEIRIDVFQGPMILGFVEAVWDGSQTWEYFWSLASAQFPELQRIEIHVDQ